MPPRPLEVAPLAVSPWPSWSKLVQVTVTFPSLSIFASLQIWIPLWYSAFLAVSYLLRLTKISLFSEPAMIPSIQSAYAETRTAAA